jgi:hypothetical protein
MEKTLKEIKEEAEQIAGEWNGDESGVLEDRANIAGDILEAIKNIEDLLEELGENDFPDEDEFLGVK